MAGMITNQHHTIDMDQHKTDGLNMNKVVYT